MKKKRHFTSRLLLCLLVCISINKSIHAEEKTYNLAINTEVMTPYNFITDKGNITGINVDIVTAILKNSNINYTFNLYPWNRAYKNALTKDNNGLISTTFTQQRKELFKWVGPLVSGKGYLYKLKSRKDIRVSQLDDAKNYSLAVVRGDVHQVYFESLGFEVSKNLMLFSYNGGYIKPFLLGKVDLILGSNIVLPYLLKELDSDIDLVEPVGEMIYTAGNFLALNINTPDEIVEKLNQELQTLKDSGEFQKIVDSYSLSTKD
jgi:polar amino acid transport system substrate-binding protein